MSTPEKISSPESSVETRKIYPNFQQGYKELLDLVHFYASYERYEAPPALNENLFDPKMEQASSPYDYLSGYRTDYFQTLVLKYKDAPNPVLAAYNDRFGDTYIANALKDIREQFVAKREILKNVAGSSDKIDGEKIYNDDIENEIYLEFLRLRGDVGDHIYFLDHALGISTVPFDLSEWEFLGEEFFGENDGSSNSRAEALFLIDQAIYAMERFNELIAQYRKKKAEAVKTQGDQENEDSARKAEELLDNNGVF